MNDQEKLQYIVDYIFKGLKLTEQEIVDRYPERNLPEGIKVTRFAPSPTGYIHIGNIYSGLIDEKMAHQSNGIFYLRIEDTDKKREVDGGAEMIVKALNRFGIKIDEGFLDGETVGNYGPYIQSERKNIYQVFVKKLLLENKAYVCFATSEELEEISKIQTEKNELIGYRKEWAIWRNKSLDEVIENLNQNKPFVIRYKSNGNFLNKINFIDQIKGEVVLPENELDVVIMKADGLPTYHFAHIIDDHFMWTTDVVRGDEWLPSVAMHLQLFETLNFKAPRYFHMAPIEKMDGDSRRKLSKRKDPEAGIEFYYKAGYPVMAIKEYFLNLINSNYEDWKLANPDKGIEDFQIDITKLKISGSLFDYDKLNFFSREYISKLTADGVYNFALGWSKTYDENLFNLLFKNKEYSHLIFNIERVGEGKKRKDICKWEDVYAEVCYFFDEEFVKQSIDFTLISPVIFNDAKLIINEFIKVFDINDDLETWFSKIKSIAKNFNYAESMKEYKTNPGLYNGYVADVAKVFRVALTGRAQSPDLYQIIKTMGYQRVIDRLNNFIKLLN